MSLSYGQIKKRLDDRGQIKGGFLTRKKADMFWEEMNKFKDTGSEATIIDTTKLTPDEVYEEVWKIVAKSQF